MRIDKAANSSRLSTLSPELKLIFSLYCLINCIAADNIPTSLLTFAVSAAIVCGAGGLPLRRFMHCIRIPLAFTAMASAALMIGAEDERSIVSLLGLGISIEGAMYALGIFLRCMGAVGAMYTLSLTTPAYAVFGVLRRIHIPIDIVETAELVYRYIFVLYDSYINVRTAQESRLGYCTLRAGYHSVSMLGAAVFLKAMQQAKRSIDAAGSRGYTGAVKTAKRQYELKPIHIVISAFVCAVLTVSGVIF